MKFPKTIRFDKSDLNVFEVPSEEGEWAISGAFEFSNDSSNSLTGKRKQSFSNGFLGLTSFGRSTLVSVSKLNLLTKDKLSDNLAKFFRSYSRKNLKFSFALRFCFRWKLVKNHFLVVNDVNDSQKSLV